MTDLEVLTYTSKSTARRLVPKMNSPNPGGLLDSAKSELYKTIVFGLKDHTTTIYLNKKLKHSKNHGSLQRSNVIQLPRYRILDQRYRK